MILMNDSERGIYRSQRGLTDKEATLLQVKHLVRDLGICFERRSYIPLSAGQMQQLADQNNKEIYDELITVAPLCKGTIDFLSDKLELAYRSGNRRKEISEAILENKD
jgi:hypothetical protein